MIIIIVCGKINTELEGPAFVTSTSSLLQLLSFAK